jgi:RNA polymerase-binding transcription factor DksA
MAKKAPAASKKAPAKASKAAPAKKAAPKTKVTPPAKAAPAAKPAAANKAAAPKASPASKPPASKGASPAKPNGTKPSQPAKPVAKKVVEAPEAAKKPATLTQSPPVAKVDPAASAAASAKPPVANQPPRPIKRPKAPPPVTQMPAGMGRLLDPKGPARKPLIPSGPKAQAIRPLGAHGGDVAEVAKVESKCPFNKRELERYRQMLLRKRGELVGDISTMENEALRGQSGALSNSPNHMAEQGSEAYDQALSLDLAAADRKLIREIDDALVRITEGTYGLCQLTGKPIKAERLEELPWARYSIEAAREMERQSMRS